MEEMKALLEKAQAAAEALEREVEEAEAANLELKKQVMLVEKAAAKADAYRQVVNAQGSHNWGYYQHLHKDELDNYWAKTADDIVYAHGKEAFYGRESTYRYYIETPRSMCANGRANALKNYGMEFEEPDGPGYRVHNVLGAPIVEISGDGITAQGIWMAHTFMSQIDADGGASPSFGLAKYGDEFLSEDGVWKMWHRRDYVDGMLKCDMLESLPFENNIPIYPEVERVEKGVKTIRQEGDMIYRPYSCTRREPAIPQPYDEWDDSQSYIQVAADGYFDKTEGRRE